MHPSSEEKRGFLSRLTDPLGGMVVDGASHSFPADEPQFFVQSFTFRAPTQGLRASADGRQSTSTRSASGSGGSLEDSAFLALAEVLERHAACCVENHRVFTASANELGNYALDLCTLPACSNRELQSPKCHIEQPQHDKPIRWVESISLMTGKPCALPFGLVYLYAGKLYPHERLQAPISTGLAAHRSLTQALVSGLLEGIERDALSLMWLQMIPSRKLGMGGKDIAMPSWAGMAHAHLNYCFFDISTDLEVPVVCCIRTAPESERAYTLVSCAAGFQPTVLVEKTVRDIGAISIGFRRERHVPSDFEDFTAIHHGATYMAHKDRKSAFSFLLDKENRIPETVRGSKQISEELGSGPEEQQLTYLLERLRTSGFEAYAVDLTSVEAFSVGMRVVRVVVPGLQPLPYRYATRYLAHSRLYDAPHRMGHRVRSEKEMNPWPLPFA